MNRTGVILDIYELHFFLYNFTGYGIVEFRRKWHNVAYTIVHVLLQATLLIHIIFCFYVTYHARDDPKELRYLTTMTMTTTICSVDVFIMTIYKKEVEELHIELMRNLATAEVKKSERFQEVKNKWEWKFAIIYRTYYFLTGTAAFLFLALPVFFRGERSVPYVFPMKTVPPSYYEDVYVFHSIILSLFVLHIVTFDMIWCGILLRVCICLELIVIRFDEWVKFYPSIDYSKYIGGFSDPFGAELQKKRKEDNTLFGEEGEQRFHKSAIDLVKGAVKFHQAILCKLDIIDQIYNITAILHLLMGPIVFTIASSAIFSNNFNFLKDVRLVGFACAGFVELFIYCYCGSHVIEMGHRVGFALYSLPWYEMDVETRRIILFALMRLNKSKGLTAGKILKLDLDLYLQVLRFAHSFIAFLKNL